MQRMEMEKERGKVPRSFGRPRASLTEEHKDDASVERRRRQIHSGKRDEQGNLKAF
jgi:hypothetical protein